MTLSTKRPLVAFDFDGTLTHKDSVLTFLKWKVGQGRFWQRMAQRSDLLIGMIAASSRGESKLSLINHVLGQTDKAEFLAATYSFFEAHQTTLFRPDALKAWYKHGELGNERVIVTGAMEPVVQPFANKLGADRLIGTQVGFNATSKTLIAESPNCIRAEKVRRLREIYGTDIVLEAAYGDTKGDHDMLKIARNPYYRVFKERA